MKLAFASILTAIAVSAPITAQNSLLFIMDADEQTLDGASGLLSAGKLKEEEVGIVLPIPGFANSAQTYIGLATQWAWRGDDDDDGRLVDSSQDAPGGETDAIMVKRFINAATGQIDPRQVCLSKEDDYTATARTWADGDVYYHPVQGVVALFISETDIDSACGITNGSDVRAICQDTNGDLYLSFADSETVNGTSVSDGGIVRIPVSGLTYDPITGDVTAVTPGTAEVIADESDMIAFTNASMVADYNGGTSTSLFDVSALDLDPNGGTWTSPVNGGTYPNLLFGWQGSGNEGAILSTAAGGSIATINGAAMGSTFQTTGTQIGLLPDATGLGGIHGLAVVDAQIEHLPLENYPINLVTTVSTMFTRQELTNATPNGQVLFLLSIGPPAIGGVLTSFPLPAPFTGELFEPATAIGIAVSTANSLGYASNSFLFPESVRGTGINVCWQAADVTRLQFSLPAPIQFL